MQVTVLGHAGFLVETEHAVVVADPWLSPRGAFESSWMQFPRNHDLAPRVRETLERSPKRRFLYLSHEHRDHFDPEFLASLSRKDVSVVIGAFRRRALHEMLRGLGFTDITVLADGQKVDFPGGHLRVYVTDSGLNRDSALLVREGDQSFLDLNDCKIHDRMQEIVAQEGRIDIFTAQFSGAIWHPVCYAYDKKTYQGLSRRKMFGKFEAVARAIEALRPRVYLSSAGPACFLDPDLLPINFEPVNIFPRAQRFFAYLRKRMRGDTPQLVEPMPGDVLDAATGALDPRGEERVTEENLEVYVRAYAARMSWVFEERRRALSGAELTGVHEWLQRELRRKLDHLTMRDRMSMPLYVCLAEKPRELIRVDGKANRVEVVGSIVDEHRHSLVTSAANLAPMLAGRMTWDELLLSLRFRIERTPDLYDAILHGYLAVEAEDLPAFCDSVREVEDRTERTRVRAGGKVWSVLRFCPHQGADLTQAWVQDDRFLVCPRHRWRFDLEEGGDCRVNGASLCARAAGEGEAPRTPVIEHVA